MKKRHIAKTISYRLLSSTTGFLLIWFSTGSAKLGATFSFAELIYKPVIYYLHERFWYKYIKIGIDKNKI